jgi:hypothetical protein
LQKQKKEKKYIHFTRNQRNKKGNYSLVSGRWNFVQIKNLWKKQNNSKNAEDNKMMTNLGKIMTNNNKCKPKYI